MKKNQKIDELSLDRRDLIKTSSILFGGLLLSGGLGNPVYGKTNSDEIFKPSKDNPLILTSNENSLGMSKKAHEAIIKRLPKAFRYLRYSSHSPRMQLMDKIANQFKLTQDNVTLGNGSSETIQAAIQALIMEQKNKNNPVQLVIPELTFEYAELYAKPFGIPIVKIPLDSEMGIDIDKMRQNVQAFKGVSIVYICNPNNPTGKIVPSKYIDKWIKEASTNQVFFIFDEAYGEYVDDKTFQSAIKWVVAKQENVLVTKTFSKIYALAGLRIGYGIGAPKLIKKIRAFVELDNINALAAVAAEASLDDKEFAKKSIEANAISRKILSDTLDELKIKYLPSQANFMFYQIKGDLKTFQKRMQDRYIMVGREFPPFTQWNRISLGIPAEMRAFTNELRNFAKKGWI
ncbi:pyridoxal phosphate-dependent aminotransferase [Helicobacter cappadocius]|uniref:Histidinol-phosphate transaminase n=1 Tax=Helicobacter cappadocius TaxID=3063998 RepID=A0AA90TAW1_9HELI|nr:MULTISPECIES: histidinol-phosphate transaminase [unclassified Helicobacter]MDO7252384.1 histidinol-phosphate transaminase [Helicobacter sp. faydin-H75]MDP2538251.1 histidinol-phosphate transaminase [Helicobacter sp. faydin-H76]